jgi:hypothetical protein
MNCQLQQTKERMMKLESISSILSKGAILLVVLLLGILYPITPKVIAQPLTVVVVHTGNVTGHLFPCPT